ncbi:hypothetical protein [Budvicia aquatica]|uniref:Uncharacterized protein n=1 Tax=Budvicia aquatica TaxID=82979 RepID=A0A484ZC37_9GAMM|nr:hypothetical protein [Budvicia aquatica]VFS45545.1 Uncharacterised protein [Budvicia aquatica]
MKQLMWAMVALAGAFSSFSARAATDIPISPDNGNNQHIFSQRLDRNYRSSRQLTRSLGTD